MRANKHLFCHYLQINQLFYRCNFFIIIIIYSSVFILHYVMIYRHLHFLISISRFYISIQNADKHHIKIIYRHLLIDHISISKVTMTKYSPFLFYLHNNRAFVRMILERFRYVIYFIIIFSQLH